MIKIKKTIFFIIKSLLTLVALLTIVLFFYAAFFYEPSVTKIQENKNQTKKTEEVSDIQSDQIKENENEKTEKVIDQPKVEKVVDVPKIEETIKEPIYLLKNKEFPFFDTTHSKKINNTISLINITIFGDIIHSFQNYFLNCLKNKQLYKVI